MLMQTFRSTRTSQAQLVLAGVLTLQLALPAPQLAQSGAPQAPTATPQPQHPGMQDDSMGGTKDGGMDTQTVTLQRHTATSGTRLAGDDIYLLVLDRFTYGPRPGDLEHLRQVGLQSWFAAQMNPGRIDDSMLEAKLDSYPAMQMSLNDMMEMYPTNGMVRRSMEHGVSIPRTDAAKAIYNDQSERYKERKAKKDGKVSTGEMAEREPVALPQSPAEVIAMPPEKRFKVLCHLSLLQLRELRKELTSDQRDHLTDGFAPPQLEAIAAFSGPGAVVEAEDIQAKLLRDIYSERQLQEVMVDFWLNHFNVYMKKSQEAPYYIAEYERNAIRPFALGRFSDLLLSTAASPAMLNYLDASESVGPHSYFANQRAGDGRKRASGLNENYAREVMELHTIGVNGGYSQKDVTNLAKVFTGWTVGKARGLDTVAQAQFDPTKHEPGDKTVLGQKVKETGMSEGTTVLMMLAASPQCAKLISTKLAVRFVSDTPPPAMINRMTAAFLETHGDIRQVLLAMINSPEFFTAETYRAKVKTPQDYVVSAVRAAGSKVNSTAGLVSAISDLGMPLFGMQTPQGYSMKTEAWASTGALVSRMNFALALASNRVQGVTTDLDALLGEDAVGLTSEQKTKLLEAKLLHVPVSDKTQRLILAQTSAPTTQQTSELRQISGVYGKNPLDQYKNGQKPADPSQLDTQSTLAAGLIFGSPEFQRR